MKFDLTTSIIAAVVGTAIAFFVTNLFLPEIENFSFKNLSSAPSTTLAQPNDEVFNYRAINPTVEVYVGQCAEYDENGECVSKITSLTSEEEIENGTSNGSGEDNAGNETPDEEE